MMIEANVDRKLDGPLAELLSSNFAQHGEFPIVVTAAGSEHLDNIIMIANECGRVRHVLRPLNAVAVWIPLEAITRLARMESVVELEMSQPMQVMRAAQA
jgi:hypothetical protein